MGEKSRSDFVKVKKHPVCELAICDACHEMPTHGLIEIIFGKSADGVPFEGIYLCNACKVHLQGRLGGV